jgi:hypothetical protein
MDDPFKEIRKGISERFARERELEHERQLAAIRAQSHALVWTGTTEELIATITKWYQSGMMVAESLQDALQKASTHFVRPDGTLVIAPVVRASLALEAISPSEAKATIEAEIRRREGLLAAYKSAMGNPSNKRIYEAGNSGVHKPEFYNWIKGKLSSDSATCINFERFLNDKRPPIPRKPHN